MESLTEPDKVVHIWTIQISRHRLATHQDIHLLDITAKSGIKAFAPDFHQVMRFKYKEIGEVEYTKLYEERMRYSLRAYPNVWDTLKNHPRVALACYCQANNFCHRHLFSVMMGKYLESQGYTPVLEGELLPPPIDTKGI